MTTLKNVATLVLAAIFILFFAGMCGMIIWYCISNLSPASIIAGMLMLILPGLIVWAATTATIKFVKEAF